MSRGRLRRNLWYRVRARAHLVLRSAMSGIHQYTALLRPVPSMVCGMEASHIAVTTRLRLSASSSTPLSVVVVDASQLQAAAVAAARSTSSSHSLTFPWWQPCTFSPRRDAGITRGRRFRFRCVLYLHKYVEVRSNSITPFLTGTATSVGPTLLVRTLQFFLKFHST